MNRDEIKYLILTSLGFTEEPDFIQSDDNAVKILNAQYEHYLSLCISKAKWNFFQKQKELLQEEDSGKYLYRYELPESMEILNNAYEDNKYLFPIRDFEMRGGYIHTNSEKCFIDFQNKVCEDMLAPYFIEYFRLFAAYNLCPMVTGDHNLEQSLFLKCQQAFIDAKAIDNLQKPPKILNTGIFTDER